MLDPFDRQIHYLRLSVTDLCNLRCRYCMPAEGVPRVSHGDILSFEEIRDLTLKATRMGFDKVRLTGGEPLVRRGIVSLVRMLGVIPGIRDFAMTTNGTLLRHYADQLREAGLHRLNISLDSTDPEQYAAITRVGKLTDVLDGIQAALDAGFGHIKLNCVIQEHPDEPNAVSVREYGDELGLEVRYIRQMDTARGEFWRVIGGDGGHCQACNRLRVSSTGMVYSCLFSDQAFSVRELGVERAFEAAVSGKPASGGCSRNQFSHIGG
jgi:cyclic pyranopterin phosphate synthase